MSHVRNKERARTNTRSKTGFLGMLIDIIMLTVVVINISFLIFDWCFDFVVFQDFVKNISYDLFLYYRDVIQPDFIFFESIFIAIFLTELIIQWIINIISKKYIKWWFYPLIHWYDVLGCVPLGYFVWLRLFRIVVMVVRLHRRGFINLKKTEIYKQVYSLYEILIHDAADRALMELIESAQREVNNESTNVSILNYGIKPNQKEFAKALSVKIQGIVKTNYHLHREDVKKQIELAIKDGFEKSEEMERVEHLPFIGNSITNRLEKLVSDITVQLADSLSNKLTSDEIAKILENIINTSLDSMTDEKRELKEQDMEKSDKQLNHITADIVDRILQKLKEDIDTKRKGRIKISRPE